MRALHLGTWLFVMAFPCFGENLRPEEVSSSDTPLFEERARPAASDSDAAKMRGSLELCRSVIAAGGEAVASPYRLESVMTLSEAGPIGGGRYRLDVGFFALETPFGIFSDGFESGNTSRWTLTIASPR